MGQSEDDKNTHDSDWATVATPKAFFCAMPLGEMAVKAETEAVKKAAAVKNLMVSSWSKEKI